MNRNLSLDQIVTDILNGVDVETKYPDFYQALMSDEALFDSLFELLNEHILDETKSLEIAVPIKPDLETIKQFKQQPPIADILCQGIDRWQAAWICQNEFLQYQLIPKSRNAILRFSGGFSVNTKLFRQDVFFGVVTYEILLNIKYQPQYDQYIPHTIISQRTGRPLKGLRVAIKWGDYMESYNLPLNGRYEFPNIAKSDVFRQDSFSPLCFTLSNIEEP